jgi:hypothetical protein
MEQVYRNVRQAAGIEVGRAGGQPYGRAGEVQIGWGAIGVTAMTLDAISAIPPVA